MKAVVDNIYDIGMEQVATVFHHPSLAAYRYGNRFSKWPQTVVKRKQQHWRSSLPVPDTSVSHVKMSPYLQLLTASLVHSFIARTAGSIIREYNQLKPTGLFFWIVHKT